MRHRMSVQTFGLKVGPRKALLRGLVNSLVEHGRIKTTLTRAKELRSHVERAVTIGKSGTLHAHRILMSRYPNEATVAKIMKEISPRFKTRPGGYTRVLKLGLRPGDRAPMAFIEFVDYTPESKVVATDEEKQVLKKRQEKQATKHRKRIRTIQAQSRRTAIAKNT